MKVCVVGGGAAGMMSAIELAKADNIIADAIDAIEQNG